MSRSTEAVRAPERILVRLPTWVGDVVMATPVLRALRTRHPHAEISLEGRAHVAPLLLGLHGIQRFWPDPGREARALWARSRELRAHGIDWAILLPDSLRVAVAPALARVPVRIGYARDLGRRLLLTRSLMPPGEGGQRVPVSMVERYLRIVRCVGCEDPEPGLDLVVPETARSSLAARLETLGIRREDVLVTVSPGAAFGSSKLWPPAHFAKACAGLAERFGLRTVLAPGPGEESIAAAIHDQLDSHAVMIANPTTSLGELAALIERSALVLSNDTGPRHMAVALGVPVITLMGPTDPRHTAHLLERQVVLREDVECSPCHLKVCPIDHRCMQRLTPDRVLEAAERLL